MSKRERSGRPWRVLIPAMLAGGVLLSATAGCANDPGEVFGPSGPSTLQALVARSGVVVEGTVTAVHSAPADPPGLVPHYADIVVDRVVRGSGVQAGDRITVLDSGGYTRGGQHVRGQSSGPFRTGDHALMFLNPLPSGSTAAWEYAPVPGTGHLTVSTDRGLVADGYDQLTRDLATNYDADQLEDAVRATQA